MNHLLIGLPEELPPFRLRTELPTVVRETCEDAQQISIWLAIRWLLGGERRKALGSREIAERAKVNQKTVTPVAERLVELRLLDIVGYEDVRNLRSRPVYRIPRWIEEENARFTLHLLVRVGGDMVIAPREQLGLFSDPKTDQRRNNQRDAVQSSDPKTDQTSDPESVQSDPKTDQTSDPKTDHLKEIKRKERDQLDSDLLISFPAPPTPPNERPIEHPIAIWCAACPQCSPTDDLRIADYAAEHDLSTGGYGVYWVGRAMLATIEAGKPLDLKYVRGLLKSWQKRRAYGADAPAYQRKERERAVGALEPTPIPVSDGMLAIWQQVRTTLQQTLTRSEYDTWIAETQLLLVEGDQAVIGTSNVFAREKLETRYHDQLTSALGAVLDHDVTVEIVIGGS